VPKVGEPAPPFSANASTGPVALSDFQGKKLVLYFYPKADTPGCTRESCAFRDASADFAKRNAAVVGVSADDVGAQQAFDQKYSLGFPLIADPEHGVLDAYGVWGERTRPDGTTTIGVRRWTFLIDEAGRIGKVYQDVTPDSHPAEILKDLDALA
jgi:thioredoxin-dependent peroxiredoxin